MAIPDLDRGQVLAFRAAGHGLATRRARPDLVAAVASVGLRRTKHTALSLAARVQDISGDDMARALESEQLVAVFGARGTVMVVPPEDVPIFTTGTAPADEESLRAALPGAFVRRLDAAGMTGTDALNAVIDAVRKALAAGPRPRGDTAMAVTHALPATLVPPCRGRCPDPHVEDSLFRLAGVNGAMRFEKNSDMLVAHGLAGRMARDEARSEFVRRYLQCYGPSTPTALALWAGISKSDARRSLAALGPEVVDVTVAGARAGVLLGTDLNRSPFAKAEGVRFLPPFDPFLLDRDRATLVPERAAQKVVWRAAGNPGVVTVDAEPVAAWRTQQRAGRTALVTEPLRSVAGLDLDSIRDEAQVVGCVLGWAGPVEVTVTT